MARPNCPRTGLPVQDARGRRCRRCGADFGGRAWMWCASGAASHAADSPATLDDRTLDEEDGGGGRRLGAWELGSLLGHGGAGAVFAATNTQTGQEAALKLLAAGRLASGHQIERFRREIQTLRELDDPGVVSILDDGATPDGELWYAMERVRGPSLTEVIAETGGLEPSEVANMVRQIAEILGRLHGLGWFHRDIKPGNILVTETGAPRLADFGLALEGDRETRLTRTHQVVGTPRYMAPEQLACAVEDWARVDIYALGLVLYELLGGQLRASADSARTLELVKGAPADLVWIARRASSPLARDRYPSCARLIQDLDRWARGSQVRNHPVAIAGRANRWFRTHKTAALSGLTAAAIAGGVIGVQVADRLQTARFQQAASARWADLAAELERLGDEGAGDQEIALRFESFVDAPDLRGASAVPAAWRWRAERLPAEQVDQAIGYASRALRLSETEADQAAALDLLAGLTARAERWQDLAWIDAMIADGDPDRAAAIALGHRELEGHLLLGGFAQHTPLPHQAIGAWGGELLFHRGEVEGPQRVDGGWLVPNFCALAEDVLRCGDRAFQLGEGAPVEIDPALFPASTTGFVQIDGRRFVSSNDQRSLVMEHDPVPSGSSLAGDWGPLHPATDALSSYAHTLAESDLDADGVPELLISMGQPYGYGVRAIELNDPVTSFGDARLGYTLDAQQLDTPAGPRAVAVTWDRIGDAGLFGADEPAGGPSRVVVLSIRDGAWQIEQELPLPANLTVFNGRPMVVADLDGDGLDEVLINHRVFEHDEAGEIERTEIRVFAQDGAGGLSLAGAVTGAYAHAAVQLDDDPADELLGDYFMPDSDAQWVAFGVSDVATPSWPRTESEPGVAALLSALGQHEEVALLLETRAAAAVQPAPLLARSAEAWRLAGDLEQASRAAGAAGDRALAADLAAEVFDFERARSLKPAADWPAAAPDFALALDGPLDPRVQIVQPRAVRHDLLGGRLHLRVIGQGGEVLRVRLRRTEAPPLITGRMDWTRAEWGANLQFALRDAGGERVVLDFLSGGSGGRLSRVALIDDLALIIEGFSWSVPAAVHSDEIGFAWTPERRGLRRADGAWRSAPYPSDSIAPGEIVELVVRGIGGAGSVSEVAITELTLRGFEVLDAEPVAADSDASKPALAWLDEGAPLPRFEGPPPRSLVAAARLEPALTDRVERELGPEAAAQVFSGVWWTAARTHPDDPEVQAALLGSSLYDHLSPARRASMLSLRGQAALRQGELDRARADLEGALAAARAIEGSWIAPFRAEAMLAELALASGDPDEALRRARAAADWAPDAALARRLLRNRPRLADRIDQPGWEWIAGAADEAG